MQNVYWMPIIEQKITMMFTKVPVMLW